MFTGGTTIYNVCEENLHCLKRGSLWVSTWKSFLKGWSGGPVALHYRVLVLGVSPEATHKRPVLTDAHLKPLARIHLGFEVMPIDGPLIARHCMKHVCVAYKSRAVGEVALQAQAVAVAAGGGGAAAAVAAAEQ